MPLLADGVPVVRGRAAEALGSIGAKGAAPAIGQMVAEFAKNPAVTSMAPDDDQRPAPPEAEAFKLGLFALVRLNAYDAHRRRGVAGRSARQRVVAGCVSRSNASRIPGRRRR